jgi:hypothetical protein
MTDWDAFRAAPAKVLGMKKEEAEAYLQANDLTPYGVAEEDGVGAILPAVVMIRLFVKGGVVVKADVDGVAVSLPGH